ncbi:MAG: hypothetical protein CM15mP127_02590 [Gammaproteobacteria bacterium]|nr:MAG: hypothetical protein CM15mP127_02590 [Gammaproteobacteria bacterium]
MWSAEVKTGLLEHHDMILMDTIGSTEGGMGGSTSSRETQQKQKNLISIQVLFFWQMMEKS